MKWLWLLFFPSLVFAQFDLSDPVFLASATAPAAGTEIVPEIAWWKFDENTGTSAADSTGNGYTGTLASGATWTAGPNGNSAVSLDGTDDKVTHAAVALTVSTWSVSFWIYDQADTPRVERVVYGEGNSGSGTFAYINLRPNGAGNGKLSFDTDEGGVMSSTAVADSTWEFWVVTKSGTTISFYRNGVSDGSGSLTYSQSTDLSTIGALRYNGSSNYAPFKGAIDDLRLFSHVLTSDEISTLYSNGAK